MIAPGAIVHIGMDPKPWVAKAQTWGGSWECVRPSREGFLQACYARAANVWGVSTPAHQIGDRVRVGARHGEIENLTPDAALVRLDVERRPLKGGGFLSHAGRVSVPLWQINAENKI